MSRYTPVPKVTAAALGGSVATLLVWAVDAIGGVSIPPEAAAALAALAAFAFGYLRAPAGTDDPPAEDYGYSVVELLVAAFFAVLIVVVLVRLL